MGRLVIQQSVLRCRTRRIKLTLKLPSTWAAFTRPCSSPPLSRSAYYIKKNRPLEHLRRLQRRPPR